MSKMIEARIAKIKERIGRAAQKQGVSPDSIKIVAVTKTATVPQMLEVLESGLKDFGINHVQDGIEKTKLLLAYKEITWHLIGHLQTNKAKDAVDRFHIFHALDSIRLAEKLNYQALKADKEYPIMVEVNISQEATKYGIAREDFFSFLEQLKQFGNLKISGLMTVAPVCDDPEESRPYFRELKGLFDLIKAEKNFPEMKYLSMGMSEDFEVAVEEGANVVRIGRAIFK